MSILLALVLLQASEEALAKKCDSQIPWMTDGIALIDMELAAGHHPQFPGANQPDYKADRIGLMEKAKAAAKEKNRLILWYCPRMYGLHMYRAVLTDRYMKATAFTDPGVVDLINAKFIPLRMCCDEQTGKALNLKPFDFVEPGFIFLTPEGKIVHKIDHLRTFNGEWFRAALTAVLRQNPEFDRDPTPKPRVRPKGVELLAQKKFDDARKALEPLSDPEALYHLAAIDLWTGKDPAPRLRAVIAKDPGSPWAWRAAANLVKGEDTLPQGPLVHHFEDFFFKPFEGLPASTRSPAKDVDGAVRGALDFLLAAQWEDGMWRDSRYAYWPDAQILPNVWMAVTGVSALALLEWRDLDPARVDAALKKADACLRDEKRLNADKNEEIYAHVFRLHYFAARKDVAALNRIVSRVAKMQDRKGFWAHEYPNPFITGVVVHALETARKAGAEVPAPIYRLAADALMSTRGSGGRQTYNCDGSAPDNEKSSMSRAPICELALHQAGKLTLADVEKGVEMYWKFVDRLEAVRLCDYHSDGRLAGFFYFHAGFHTLEAARALSGPARESTQKRFRERLLAIPEWDGSFVDSHEIGKSYGTASALLMLGRCR
jgi:hypothetical protein